MSVTTTTPQTSRIFFVTFSPRGFANETACRAFASKVEADDFRHGIDNDVNSYSYSTDSAMHQRKVRELKREAANYSNGDVLAFQGF